VLPHEDPAEFEATVQGWLTHYQPDTPPAPAEYAWAQPVQMKEGETPRKVQMLWQHWLKLIEREDATDTGHISPY
jgi:hypothetical protein